MSIHQLDEILREHPFFEGFDDDTIDLLAGCAQNVHLRPDELVIQEGKPANHFYLVRRGRVAIQIHRVGTASSIIDTVEAGEVLGYSWLVPPYRWQFDARATEDSSVISFDAACIRTKCDNDQVVGYAFISRIAQLMQKRLEASRLRLLDIYGASPR